MVSSIAFWNSNLQSPLSVDYRFHALPDACTYIVFDQLHAKIAGVTRLRASSEELNLGKVFHYINIRFLPGVWQGNRELISYGMVEAPYAGDLPLAALNQNLIEQDFAAKQTTLSQFVEKLIEIELVVANSLSTAKIFQNIDEIHSVADMAGCLRFIPTPTAANPQKKRLDSLHTRFFQSASLCSNL